MEQYLMQLLNDIAVATENVNVPWPETNWDICDWVSEEEEDKQAPVRNLQEWTGIYQEQLPPAEMLTDEQVNRLLVALNKMLDAYNWSFVVQTEVPLRIQYKTIRDNFNQPAKVKRWHMGLFEVCKKDTPHKQCSLSEYCQCAFFAEFFPKFEEEELSPEEERARMLQIEIEHLKRKYDDDWMKYYPYHLDANYDDEYGNPYDYGMGDDEDEEDDDWWRK